jgi:hypothetical protein
MGSRRKLEILVGCLAEVASHVAALLFMAWRDDSSAREFTTGVGLSP